MRRSNSALILVLVDEFGDRRKARESYKTFAEAMHKGRDIMRRAGVTDAPPIPEFETVFRRLTPEMRQELYALLRDKEEITAAEAIRLWQPFVRRAFGQPNA